MKNIFLLFIVSLFTFSSCDDGFESVNTDPYNPTVVEPDLLLANATVLTSNLNYLTSVAGDQGACWVQQWAKVQYNDEERYAPRSSTSGTMWLLYTGIQELKEAEMLALAEGNDAIAGAAVAMQGFNYQLLADLFGDIPYSEANLGNTEGIFTPKYDDQQEVYGNIVDLYTRSMTLLSSGNGIIASTTDRVFSGDASKWLKFAASLKFRALMRVSNATSVTNTSLANINTQLSSLMSNLMTSNDDSAFYQYFPASPDANPYFETISEGNRIEYRINKTLVDHMVNTGDTRLAVYAQDSPDGGIVGAGSGVADVPNATYNYNNTSQIGVKYLDAEAPAYFLRYSEIEFLKAEAAMRGLISGNAADFYANGVTASFAENGVASDAATFIGSNPMTAQSIGEQKWVALYGQGFEAWIEWRRTSLPVLSPAVDPIAITEIPSRYTYPVEEQAVNGTNYLAAVANQGSDELTTKVWWNK